MNELIWIDERTNQRTNEWTNEWILHFAAETCVYKHSSSIHSATKVRFLTQLRHILRKAETPSVSEATKKLIGFDVMKVLFFLVGVGVGVGVGFNTT